MEANTTISQEVEPSQPELVLDEVQIEAINASCNLKNRIVAVTGAAGTGKTSILRKTYHAIAEAGYRVVLCAPTGKAAKRIKEATGIDAMTVHRLLEYTHPGEPDPKTGKPVEFSYPRRTRQNPLDVDVVLCDEYAMVAWEQHNSLIAALPPGGCIRMFGDDNQLDPIEEGRKWDAPPQPTPFQTIMQKFTTVRLRTVYRQGKDSGILHNLHLILNGRMPTRNDQWDMTFTDRPVDALRKLVLDALEEGHDFASPDCQIISVQNKSWVGTAKLNLVMQAMFQQGQNFGIMVPRDNWVVGPDGEKGTPIKMYVGDKVICTSNMYDLDIMNGESGKITEISSDGEIVVDFGDKTRVVPPIMQVLNRYGRTVEIDPRKKLDLGYVITTHKSQGSQYRRVVYVINKSTQFMQSRRNLYTACSRGMEHVHVITDQISLATSLRKKG